MLKKFKSLFIKEEEIEDDLKSPSKDIPPKKDIPQREVPQTENQSAQETLVNSNKPTKKFVDILLKAMEKNNLEGVDYLEFKQSLKSLDGVIQEEDLKYKSAFAMGSTMGMSKENLLKSGQHYIDVLKDENKKFQVTYENQRGIHVEQREGKIKSLTQGIEHRKKQIEALNQEIKKLESQLKEENKAMSQSYDKLQNTKTKFDASYKYILDKINEDFEKINKYL